MVPLEQQFVMEEEIVQQQEEIFGKVEIQNFNNTTLISNIEKIEVNDQSDIQETDVQIMDYQNQE